MNKLHLTSCLLLYQNRQDRALGLDYITAKQNGLLWYYRTLQSRFVTAAYLNNIIQQSASRIKELVKEAQTAKDKHQIARQVIALQEIIEKANGELKEIASKE